MQLIPENRIVIQLHDSGGEPAAPLCESMSERSNGEELEATLNEDIYTLRMDKVAFLQGDPGVNFQYVADVMDGDASCGE